MSAVLITSQQIFVHILLDLQKFVQWYRYHGKKVPNLTQLSMHGMPAAAGRKGTKMPRKKTSKKSLPVDDNRIPLSAAPVSSDPVTPISDVNSTSTICHNVSSLSGIFNAFNTNVWPSQNTSPNHSHYQYMWYAYSPWS